MESSTTTHTPCLYSGQYPLSWENGIFYEYFYSLFVQWSVSPLMGRMESSTTTTTPCLYSGQYPLSRGEQNLLLLLILLVCIVVSIPSHGIMGSSTTTYTPCLYSGQYPLSWGDKNLPTASPLMLVGCHYIWIFYVMHTGSLLFPATS